MLVGFAEMLGCSEGRECLSSGAALGASDMRLYIWPCAVSLNGPVVCGCFEEFLIIAVLGCLDRVCRCAYKRMSEWAPRYCIRRLDG